MDAQIISLRSPKGRRDATRIVYEILLSGKLHASATQIVNRVNLNSRLARQYVKFLLAKGLLEEAYCTYGLRRFSLTSRGVRLLNHLEVVEDELRGLFPNGK